MKLSEMRQILSDEGIQLTKSLGQNFMHDANQLRRIVNAAELQRTDRVLEIGPGLGPLTELLIAAAGQVLAIEKDARLVQFLEKRFAAEIQSGRLQLIHDDALDALSREPRDWDGWKVVANLPYSVASPILVELAQAPAGPAIMVVTLQLEVAKRLVAKAGQEAYGILTLLVQVEYEPAGMFKIPAGCFFPEPDVDSACVILRRRKEPMLSAGLKPAFVKLVKASFAQRRKRMLKLVKTHWPEQRLDAAFTSLGIHADARAESLELETFAALTKLLEGGS